MFSLLKTSPWNLLKTTRTAMTLAKMRCLCWFNIMDTGLGSARPHPAGFALCMVACFPLYSLLLPALEQLLDGRWAFLVFRGERINSKYREAVKTSSSAFLDHYSSSAKQDWAWTRKHRDGVAVDSGAAWIGVLIDVLIGGDVFLSFPEGISFGRPFHRDSQEPLWLEHSEPRSTLQAGSVT